MRRRFASSGGAKHLPTPPAGGPVPGRTSARSSRRPGSPRARPCGPLGDSSGGRGSPAVSVGVHPGDAKAIAPQVCCQVHQKCTPLPHMERQRRRMRGNTRHNLVVVPPGKLMPGRGCGTGDVGGSKQRGVSDVRGAIVPPPGFSTNVLNSAPPSE